MSEADLNELLFPMHLCKSRIPVLQENSADATLRKIASNSVGVSQKSNDAVDTVGASSVGLIVLYVCLGGVLVASVLESSAFIR